MDVADSEKELVSIRLCLESQLPVMVGLDVWKCAAHAEDDGECRTAMFHRLGERDPDAPAASIIDLHEVGAVTGIIAFANERWRQVSEEGFVPEDDEGRYIELVKAAGCYLDAAFDRLIGNGPPYPEPSAWRWPWPEEWWKPSEDVLRNLEKAGACMAAAYDSIALERADGH